MPERILEALKASATVVAAIVGLALWGARLEFQVSQKASRDEVAHLQQQLELIHAEAKTIRLILCDGAARDSYCRSGR
jgi:hypothetical protein